ncbi:MAG: DMT family transporter [Spirobacillus cienkowskii]|jgi:drug/metabolite transporter (DMT)-like permease|uniref:DMT family transporter n=1 Tax=Spirobacillus cienkowskii TaxID=495820 RepID=A0A369KTF0_9BACT|nr:MAG: DMT family transporter [Spirobacillus cienkowskii]
MKIISLGAFYTVIAAFLWGVLSVFAKQMKLEGFSAAELSQLRIYGVGFVLFAFFLIKDRKSFIVSKSHIGLLFLAGIFGQALNVYFYFLSVQSIPAGIAVLIEYLAPVFIGIVSLIIGWEKFSKKMLISFFLISLGFVVSLGSDLASTSINQSGMMFAVLSAIFLAAYALISKPLLAYHSPLKILAFGMWSAGLFWVSLKNPLIVLEKIATYPDYTIIVAVVLVIFLCTLLPFWLYLSSIKLIGPTKATMIACLEPFFSSVLCAIFLNEILTPTQYLGGAIVLAGIIVIESRSLKPKRAKIEVEVALEKDQQT